MRLFLKWVAMVAVVIALIYVLVASFLSIRSGNLTVCSDVVSDAEILNVSAVPQGLSVGPKAHTRQTVLYRYTTRTLSLRIGNWAFFVHLESRKKTQEHEELMGAAVGSEVGIRDSFPGSGAVYEFPRA